MQSHDDKSEPSDRKDAPDSAELLRLMVESATDYAIFAIDPGGIVTSWNSGAERVLGFRADEIMGRSADVIFTPEDRAVDAAGMERKLAASDGRAEDERWTLRADGSRFWASGLMLPLADRARGFVKILRDRTEAHLAEMRIRHNEERFRILATNVPQLVFRSRPDGTRTWGSPQWIEFTGLDLERSVGQGWLDAIHPDDIEATHAGWVEARQSGEYHVEHRVRRHCDGQWRWHQTRARPVRSPGAAEDDWVGTMADVHDLRQARDQQQILMAELQHRTRNLLAVVQSIATQTRRNSDSLEKFGREFESRLRALSRAQALWAHSGRPDVDLRDLVVTELAAHGDDASNSGRVNIEGPSLTLRADAALVLGLGLHELATNAAKYGALAQPSGKLFITWRVEEEDGRPVVALEWTERNVTLASGAGAPRKGYGSELIERALPYQLGARTSLDFQADGVRCSLLVPIEAEEEAGRHA